MEIDFNRIAGAVIRVLRETAQGREEAAGFAVHAALRQLVAGDAQAGLATLDYAQRAAPSDGGITFAIGLVRLALGVKRATEPLELMAARTGWREALLYLVHARRRFGDPDRAASELHRLLSANAPDRDPAFTALADAVALDTGSLGWCGLDTAGQVTLGGAAATLPWSDLAFSLDGRPLCPRRHRAAPRRAALPDGWARARRLAVTARGRPLIGSPIDIAQVTRMEGFAAATPEGGIEGWCWLPGERETAPQITLRAVLPEAGTGNAALPPPSGVGGPQGRAGESGALVIAAEASLEDRAAFPAFAAPRRFAVTPEQLAAFPGGVEIRGPHGRPLYGSPLRPNAALDSGRAAARAVAALYPASGAAHDPGPAGREPSIPARLAATRPAPAAPPAPPRGIDVVIPVYRGLKVTLACLGSVLAAREDERIVVVIDASPEPELVAALQKLERSGAILLRNETVNRGFPATANIGLRIAAAAGHDAVLLNSDTLTPPGWLAALRDAVHSAHDIGSATPLSNDATIFSYPRTDEANPPPDLEQVVRTHRLARQANAGVLADVPTGHGFCMYIRAGCLAETGVLREDVFAQGYGEENDFSLRARVLGWRHVAVPGAFVGHVGSQSFAATRSHLIERNLATLNRLHPGYDALVQDWLAADPLAGARRRIDRLRFQADARGRRAVLLVSHGRGGGVLRHVRERAALHEHAGERALLLRPGRGEGGGLSCSIADEAGEATPNLTFRLPEQIADLRLFLQQARVRLIELHHFIGHDAALLALVRDFGTPYDVYVHDYAWFCPRVTLTTGAHRYCGEPKPSACAACVADHGHNIDEDIAPEALRARSAGLLAGARTVVAPSWDTARRIERHFPGIDVSLGVWERASPRPPAMPSLRGGRRRRVCVVGAIGPEKGYATLLGAARHAAEHDLPLDFSLVGFSCDDLRLLETGRVTITGRYEEHEAVRLIRAQDADFAFLPALWPETWSYVLSQIWEAGLQVAALDIGAPAERIRATGGGVVLPLHMPPGKLAEDFASGALFGAAPAAAGPGKAASRKRAANVQWPAQWAGEGAGFADQDTFRFQGQGG